MPPPAIVPRRPASPAPPSAPLSPPLSPVASPHRPRKGRQTVTKPADVKKRTIVPAATVGVKRDLIIDEKTVDQRRSLMASRPPLCELCSERSPVARLVRNGFGIWACKKCVRSAREEFENYGTLRGARTTMKTRVPAPPAHGDDSTLRAPHGVLAGSATLDLQAPPPPPDEDSLRKPPPSVPPPHAARAAPRSPSMRPIPPLRQKATPESIGFPLDIAEIEDLLDSTVSLSESVRIDDDMDEGDDDSDEIADLYNRSMVHQPLPHAPDSLQRGDTFDEVNERRVSFRDKHGSVASVVFIENEEEIFANLDDDDLGGTVNVDYLDDESDTVPDMLDLLPAPLRQ
jgi:ribosomal protein L37AE/L43A